MGHRSLDFGRDADLVGTRDRDGDDVLHISGVQSHLILSAKGAKLNAKAGE